MTAETHLEGDPAVREFLDGIRANHEARTAIAYRADLADLVAFLTKRARGVHVELTFIGQETLSTYLADLVTRGFEPTTVRRRMVTIRLFCRFLVASGRRRDNPTDGLRVPPEAVQRRAERPGLSPHEIAALLQPPVATAPPRAHRDHAIVQLIAAGLSVSEVAALTMEHVASVSEALPARLPPPARTALQTYLRMRPRLVAPGSPTALFVNDRGQHLTRQGVWLIVQRVAQATGQPRWAQGARLDTRLLVASLAAAQAGSGESAVPGNRERDARRA
jgi:integrase/recombinase XerD